MGLQEIIRQIERGNLSGEDALKVKNNNSHLISRRNVLVGGAAFVLDACAATLSQHYVEIKLNSETVVVPLAELVRGNTYDDQVQMISEGILRPGTLPGVTYDGKLKTPITAAASGTIVFAMPINLDVKSGTTTERFTQNIVVIDHGFGYQTLYVSLDDMQVSKGQNVKRGQVIGLLGNTTAFSLEKQIWYLKPHLHMTFYVPDFIALAKDVKSLKLPGVSGVFGTTLGDPEQFGLKMHYDGSNELDAQFQNDVENYKKDLLGLQGKIPATLYNSVKDFVGRNRPSWAVDYLVDSLGNPGLSEAPRKVINDMVEKAFTIRLTLTLPWMNPQRPELYNARIIQRP